MVHTFKIGGHRIAYDSVSGYVLPLSELAYKMLDYIELPMPPECSSALRYDLAKYDSVKIKEEYNRIYSLYRDGKLFAQDSEDNAIYRGAVVMVGDTVVNREMPHIAEVAAKLAGEKKSCTVRIVPATSEEHAFSDTDIPWVEKELVSLAKLQLRQGRGNVETPVRAFEKFTPCSHEADRCRFCWARKLCSVGSPQHVVCALEKKRIECVMITASEEK